ncbi:dipeptide/oligopeptide/nickel ABC transporter permease/ATP-binding protein [Streptomyces sp. NPDC090493]|uniref:dipeptide/oligopeptide/nickel ABC transporter permease/ATP-binding protein n=1 Tax=Streptomyces sp. NPDC090493 TaxID=3365964 RepID=UPI00380E8590
MTAAVATTTGAPAPGRTPGLFTSLLRRPAAVVPAAVLLVIVIACAAAGLLAPYSATAGDLAHPLAGPSTAHLLGTDQLGRDVLSRLMYGGLPTLLYSLEAVVAALVVGVPLGLLSGSAGGWIDRTLMQLVDIGMSAPGMVIILVVVSVFQGEVQLAMIALGLLSVPALARNIRGAAVAVRHELFVDAARVSGLPPLRIVFRHILPRVRGPVLVQATLLTAMSLLVTTGLAFLGFGVAPPQPTWGSMTSDAAQVLSASPWMLIGAGGVTGCTVLCLGLLGDAIRDAMVGAWAGEPVRSRTATVTADPAARADEPAQPDPAALLSLRGLTVSFRRGDQDVPIARGIDLDILAGETVGLVGESGCGKTSVARAIVGLPRGGGHVTAGRIVFGGQDVTALSPAELRRFRGAQVALVSQEPITALDPTCRIGTLLGRAVRAHARISRREVRERVLELLRMVRLPDPEHVARLYPHEMSGGMAQRVAIARALAGRPRLLVADEPTSALDVTLQSEILELLRSLREETGMAILIITHDWGVVADLCDRSVVMYAGQIAEQGPVEDLFRRPAHPYTGMLLASHPSTAMGDGPVADRALLTAIPGSIPPLGEWPVGCRFGDRCPHAVADCLSGPVQLLDVGKEHRSRCLRSAHLLEGPLT